ncbi:hypothetical protein ILYODFUR_019501 [Ilyodon furcidens]|uniref:Secreted protein n=1 Tax=Ilyodon furcidens TaxID=33524 RepID=A0ABV0VFV4_9TELE
MFLALGTSLLLHPAYPSHSLVLMHFCSQLFGRELPLDTSPLVQQHTSWVFIQHQSKSKPIFSKAAKMQFRNLLTDQFEDRQQSCKVSPTAGDKGFGTCGCNSAEDLI